MKFSNKLIKEIQAKIKEAKAFSKMNGMVSCVYIAFDKSLEKYHIGFRFTEEGTKVGDKQHYDQGFGFEKNKDAEILWVNEE
jgi:hypothetical protein